VSDDRFEQSNSPQCFSLVRYIPEWFPGANFKRLAAEWKAVIERSVNVPYERCIERIVSIRPSLLSRKAAWLTIVQREGKAVVSVASVALGEDLNPSPEDDFDLRWSLNTLYLGGIDSVSGNSPDHSPTTHAALQVCGSVGKLHLGDGQVPQSSSESTRRNRLRSRSFQATYIR